MLDSDGSSPSSSDDEALSTGNGFQRHFRFRSRYRLPSTPQPVMGSKRLLSPNRLRNTESRDPLSDRHFQRGENSDESSSESEREGEPQSRTPPLGLTSLSCERKSLSEASWFGSGWGGISGGTSTFEPLQHPSVLALKLESLNDSRYLRSRLCNGTYGRPVGVRETDQLGVRPRPSEDAGSCWSLSDSCFETFSGSTPQVNESTVL